MKGRRLVCFLFVLSALFLVVPPAFSADTVCYDRGERISNVTVNQIVDKFIVMQKTKQICLTDHMFQINSQKFLALGAIVLYNEKQPSSDGELILDDTQFFVCKISAKGDLGSCDRAALGYSVVDGYLDIKTKGAFISFEISKESPSGDTLSTFYYTFKYVNGGFYLHQYSLGLEYAEGDEEPSVGIYYKTDAKKGYNIPMNKVNEKMIDGFIKEYEDKNLEALDQK